MKCIKVKKYTELFKNITENDISPVPKSMKSPEQVNLPKLCCIPCSWKFIVFFVFLLYIKVPIPLHHLNTNCMNHYKVNICFVDQKCKRELSLHDIIKHEENVFKKSKKDRFWEHKLYINDNTQVIGTVLFELLLVWVWFRVRVRVMVFSATFNNISVKTNTIKIKCRSKASLV